LEVGPKRLCGENNNCIKCINKSFASVDYSKNWSNKNIVSPFEIFKNSHKKYLFECPKCKHTFEQKLSHITRGNTCNYCCIPSKRLCSESTNCIICFTPFYISNADFYIVLNHIKNICNYFFIKLI
jgi:CMP-N-acetylneuraminic acid synthetase